MEQDLRPVAAGKMVVGEEKAIGLLKKEPVGRLVVRKGSADSG
jgi:hypothetical protein